MEQNSNETSPETTSAHAASATETPDASAPAQAAATPEAPTTETPATADPAASEAPKKRAPRRATSRKQAPAAAEATDAPATETSVAAEARTPTDTDDPEAPKEAPKRASRARKKVTPADEGDASASSAEATETQTAPADEAPANEAPVAKKAPARRRKAAAPAATDTPATDTPATDAPAVDASAKSAGGAPDATSESAPDAESAEQAPATPRKRARRATTKTAETQAPEEAQAPAEAQASPESAPAPGEAPAASPAEAADETPETTETPKRNTRSRSRAKGNGQDSGDKANAGEQQPRSQRGQRGQQNQNQQQQQASKQAADADASSDAQQDQDEGNRQRQDREDQQSRSRTRQRDRKRRGQQTDDLIDPELTEDDVLLPIAGILDVLDNYAFVRTTGYLPGPSDVYVSLGQVKKYNLRKGDAIVGSIRKPSEQDGGGRQKYNAIVKIDTVNGTELAEDMQRVDFGDLTPLYPQERLRLETAPEKVTQRMIDLISPIGKGQRGLIVAPPKAGKTIVLQQIANAIAENNPEVHLMVVLVDERPEEVTDMQRTVKGEVVASTFDRPAEDHTTVAELAIERAKRLVELGHDVVVLLDSITRLGRAYNLASPASGRVLTGGVDASALYPPKRFFGAARNIEHGGSLTILATALVETGSKADEVIFEEFKGTGNMELRLSRQLADKRIFPAVNLNASSTRREEMLLSPDEVKITWKLRRALGNLSEEQAAELVLSKLRETQSNAEFLLLMQKSQGLS